MLWYIEGGRKGVERIRRDIYQLYQCKRKQNKTFLSRQKYKEDKSKKS
jgi:hypothetical protein